MKVGQRAAVTHAGRKRRRNEDDYVVDPPLFAVADGMGGAQAGEVASRLATEAFREFHAADGLDGEERLTAIIQEANKRIYERAQTDAQASGMGTTVTAALVVSAGVTIGHVGDSRAYRIRGGELEQLTQDHSLVADLMRSGRLTAEEAESHPQRSVITRALGTDAEVDVDTTTVEAEPGDVFLICSDGLTTMVGNDAILRAVQESRDLEAAASALVKAANREGGEDNVTVVLFTVEADAAGVEETAQIATNGQGTREDLEDTLTDLQPVAPAPRSTDAATHQPPEREASGWEPVGPAAAERRAPRRRWRGLVVTLLLLALVAVVVVVAFWGLAKAHFVGASADGRIAVYQGVPWDVGAGISLYRPRYVSDLRAVQLTVEERRQLFDHDLTDYADARRRVAAYELGGVEGA
ncbi:MAG: Stp1/IreP family PP2C-type Ser/Thr phosphatase [Actinobacteria bacterium]|nr:Stp1/IreP family PP2C-type Ser/Thr phosphatase [Actinomycetota bacterium]